MRPAPPVDRAGARPVGFGAVEGAVVLTPLVLALALVLLVAPSPAVGAAAVAASLVVPAAVAVTLLRRRAVSAPDAITLGRVVLTGALSAAAVLVLADELAERTWTVAAVVGLALLMDAVDGWVARRTSSATLAGARLDMESDAALLLVLSLLAVPTVSWWVLGIGAMRYLFVLASWVRPALQADLTYSELRRVVAALQGVALLIVLVPVVPVPLATVAAALALVALAGSFARDVVALEART
ncbi:CDP-alcohol phosphatidyltransferase family protein [Serinicoccus kebangsaanensis]|uniref:CDP-alcohol phosphatidyltransferase family protein n=1 Tax=Serinicoccus kebangsaanensis TaxID=2602069 RepID=UPI00124C4B73|nr:CDP-alcohol phosphatidyltransferase family protein [Serinicoccus kebangsaanensis]